MPIYPYSFTMPPVNKQDIPSDGVVGEFLGISAGGVLDWLPVSASGSGDMLKSENLSGLADYAVARTNIGLGLTSSPEFANLTLTSPSLASSAPVTISQTWNAGGNVMTALKVVATDTASGATSNLLELWAGNAATLKSRIDKNGDFYGRSLLASGNIALTSSGSYYTGYLNSLYIDSNSIVTNQGGYFGFAAVNNSASNLVDVKLFRDGAANTLALRNSAAAQTFRVYETFTDASNYSRVSLTQSSVYFFLQTEAAGTGTKRGLILRGNGTNSASFALVNSGLIFGTSTIDYWTMPSSGHFLAGTDNTYNIGANGASRPQNIFVGQTVRANAFQLNSLSHIYGTVEGIIGLYNNALSDFNRLQFGGTTNLFPAIKRNAAGLQIRLADDSANATLEAGNLYASGNVGIGTTDPDNALTVRSTTNNVNGVGQLILLSSDALAADKGGRFGLAGIYDNANGRALFAEVAGLKENATSGNWAGYLTLRTRAAGGAITDRLRIDSAGNVGIGTTAPNALLDVYGAGNPRARFTVTNTTSGNFSAGLDFYTSTGEIGNFLTTASSYTTVGEFVANSLVFQHWGTGKMIFATRGVAPIQFQINGFDSSSVALKIDTNKNVGIGTTAPGAKLEVVENTSNLAALIVRSSSVAAPRIEFIDGAVTPNRWTFGIGATSTTDGLFALYDARLNAVRLAINASGNVGIGTTSPTSKLHVAGTIKPEQATMVDKAAGFTLAAVDAGTVINSTSATAITINLPAADTAAGYNVMIIQSGAGAVTIAANGNTLNSFGNALITAGQHAACSIVRTAASTYNLSGNLV